VDIGTARFRASRGFEQLLQLAQQKTDTEVGRRLETLVGRVRGGRVSYDRLAIPLGEFTLQTEGSYNLTDGRVNVVTLIPVGALSDRAMGVLNTGIGAQFSRMIPGLERLTMIPWRTSGLPGQIKTEPDFEVLRQDLTRALNPADLIDGLVGGLRRNRNQDEPQGGG
jgi:hypothetical protein